MNGPIKKYLQMALDIFKNLIYRINTSISKFGVQGTILKLPYWITDRAFDYRYGTDTCSFVRLSELTIDSENKEKGSGYEATYVTALRKVFKLIKPFIKPDDVLVDFGSGKGRVLIIASEYGFKTVRGIEFATELCETAKKNCKLFEAKKKTKTNFQIIEVDAVKYQIQKDEVVFFMFNPFNEEVLTKVLNNIKGSVRIYPRKIFLVYQNPKYGNLFEDTNFLSVVKKFKFGIDSCVVFSSKFNS